MKVLQIPLIIILLIITSACGKKSNGNKKTAPITPEQVTNLLDHQVFECASSDGGKCPEGIARVFILNEKVPTDSEMCTGFLVSSNKLVTNFHCVSTQKQCANTYFSIYNGSSYEVAKCQNLITAEDDGEPLETKKIDYAVLELDRHVRTAEVFELAKSLPRIRDQLTVWVVDHVDLFVGRITDLKCELNNREFSLEMSTCAAISGNSGSPVLNKDNKVVGVLWGSTTSEYIDESTPLDERRNLDDQGYATEASYISAGMIMNDNESKK